MTSDIDLDQHQFLLETFGNRYDQSYVPIWGGHWSDYSGFGWSVIFDKNGKLYEICHGYHPGSDFNEDAPEWNPVAVTYEYAIDHMIQWDKLKA
jgi:hypothetical protein